jgi:hypothetical protein
VQDEEEAVNWLDRSLAQYERERGLPEGSAFPSHLGVYCDECEIVFESDFIIHEGTTKQERLKVVRDYVVQVFGWTCGEEDLCANCQPGADPKLLRAPWTTPQIEKLNSFQGSGKYHPFTCGAVHSGHRILKAFKGGWHCPELDCDYVQRWAPRFMLHPDATCLEHGHDCEPDDHIEPPTFEGEVI